MAPSFQVSWLHTAKFKERNLFIMEQNNFLMAQMVKNLCAMQETQVWSLGQENPLEEGMVTHSNILAWRTPRTEEPGGLSIGSQRVGHHRVPNTTHTHTHTHTHTQNNFQRFPQQRSPWYIFGPLSTPKSIVKRGEWGSHAESRSIVIHPPKLRGRTKLPSAHCHMNKIYVCGSYKLWKMV